MDQRFDTMDQRFDTMDQRFDTMDQRFDSLHLDVVRIEKDHGDKLEIIFDKLTQVDERLDALHEGHVRLERGQASLSMHTLATSQQTRLLDLETAFREHLNDHESS